MYRETAIFPLRNNFYQFYFGILAYKDASVCLLGFIIVRARGTKIVVYDHFPHNIQNFQTISVKLHCEKGT